MAASIGSMNNYQEIKMPDGSWVYVGKKGYRHPKVQHIKEHFPEGVLEHLKEFMGPIDENPIKPDIVHSNIPLREEKSEKLDLQSKFRLDCMLRVEGLISEAVKDISSEGDGTKVKITSLDSVDKEEFYLVQLLIEGEVAGFFRVKSFSDKPEKVLREHQLPTNGRKFWLPLVTVEDVYRGFGLAEEEQSVIDLR